MTDDDRLRASAEIHEASHAVVGWAQGRRIQVVAVPRSKVLAGFVHFEPLTGLSPLEAAIVELTTIEAGALGDELLGFEVWPVRPTDEAGYAALTERWIEVLSESDRAAVRYALSAPDDGENDETTAARIASEVAPAEAVWLIAFCRARAARLITEHRAAILALAAELSRRPILAGPAAEAIIEAHERSTTA